MIGMGVFLRSRLVRHLACLNVLGSAFAPCGLRAAAQKPRGIVTWIDYLAAKRLPELGLQPIDRLKADQ